MPIGKEMPQRNVCRLIYPIGVSERGQRGSSLWIITDMNVDYRVKGDARVDLGDVVMLVCAYCSA